jgi:hypothetical protein
MPFDSFSPTAHYWAHLFSLAALLSLVGCGGKEDPQVLTAQQLGDMPDGRAIKLSAGQSVPGGIVVAELIKVSEVRFSRTHFDYTFKLRVVNNDSVPWTAVGLNITGTGTGTAVVDGRSSVGFLPIAGGVSPPDTVTLRQDRTKTFELARLTWSVTGNRIAQTAVGPEQTGVPDKVGVAVTQAGATIMAVDGSASAPPRISIHPMVRIDVKPEFLVGGALFEFHGVTSSAVGLVQTTAVLEGIYECELDRSSCMVLPSVGRTPTGRVAFPIKPAKMYAIGVN